MRLIHLTSLIIFVLFHYSCGTERDIDNLRRNSSEESDKSSSNTVGSSDNIATPTVSNNPSPANNYVPAYGNGTQIPIPKAPPLRIPQNVGNTPNMGVPPNMGIPPNMGMPPNFGRPPIMGMPGGFTPPNFPTGNGSTNISCTSNSSAMNGSSWGSYKINGQEVSREEYQSRCPGNHRF